MATSLRKIFAFVSFFAIVWLAQDGWAQGIMLPASGTYTESFDNLSAGLPTGWTVRTGATTSPPRLGTEFALTTAPTAWNDAAPGFKNVASADGLSQSATPSEQITSTDRALGVRQTDTFGDPGAAFILQIANTLGASNLNLKFKIQSLDATSSRTTTWRVEYGSGTSFTTGGKIFSNGEIDVNIGPGLSNNRGPVFIRIITASSSSGSGERPTTAIDDVTLTYSTRPNVTVSALNTLTYGLGDGPATQDFSIQGDFLTGSSALTVISNSPSVFTVSSDGVNFSPSIVIPYTDARSVSATIKVRLTAGLSVGAYRSLLSVRGSGLDYGYFLSGLVTQATNQPTIGTTASLTGTNGFRYTIGGGPIIKLIDLFGDNLTGVPGSLTLTSSNPAVFQLIGNDNVRRSTFTTNYDNPNLSVQFSTVVLIEGLAAGEYTGTIVVSGGGAPSVTIPLSGTVTTDNSPGSLSVNPKALSAFSTMQGSPSALRSFTVTGRNFDPSNQLQIGVPAGFEGALFNSNFYSQNPSVLLGSGNFDIPVTIRMTGATSGSFSGNVTIRVGASSTTLPVTGTVNPVGTGTQSLSVTLAGYNSQTGVLTFGRIGGDPNRAVEYSAVGVKSFSTSPVGLIEAEKRADPNSGTTITLKARYVGDPASEVAYVFNFGTFCTGGTTPTPSTLRLIEPAYNCQTGAITFRTQGGNGTPIEYSAIGIKSFSASPDGVIEAGKRADPNSGTTVLLKARYVGDPASEVSYVFDFGAYCAGQPTPISTGLQVIEPIYNCQTGTITFRTQGGDGTPIEYGAIGVKSFSTNPNGVIEAEKRGDPNSGTTVELKARQSGREVGFVFDFAAYCRNRSARQAASGEVAETLRINVLGNPVGNELTVLVSGVAGRPLQLRLTDVRGHLIEQRNLGVTANTEWQTFNVHRQPSGLLFLQAISGEQRITVKVMKP